MFIVKNRNIFFAITGAIVLASLLSFFVFGLHVGTDFTGGTLIQVTYANERPAPDALSAALDDAGFAGYSLREAGENDYILRAENLTDEQRSNIKETFSVDGKFPATISQLTEVGPTIGK